MKNKDKGCDLARIRSVIEGDRLNVSADVEKMLSYDLTCVLGGYFDFCTRPSVIISPCRGGYSVEISFSAGRVKATGVRAI